MQAELIARVGEASADLVTQMQRLRADLEAANLFRKRAASELERATSAALSIKWPSSA